MSLAREVSFLRSASIGATSGGFESATAVPAAPDRADQPTTADQKARAADLFLRGTLSADDYETARTSQGGFEALIGRSNLLPASFLEVGAAVSRCTCIVRTSGVDFKGRSGAWSGTAFLLGPNILVTNHHVLNSKAVAAAADCVFNFQTDSEGRPAATRSFRLRPDSLFLTSPAEGGLDYTFVRVDGEPGREFGTARVSRQAFAIGLNEFANVVSHPDGRMKEVCLQENVVLWQDDLVVHYSSDTEGGSSGASVCNNGWQLVALHHASRPANVAGHTLLNEGVKLSAIAADLERLARAGSTVAAELLSLFGGADQRLGFFGALGRPVRAATGLEAVVHSFQGDEADIDVGFWNVEWLTNRHATKATAVARVIRDMSLDVWSLEESSPDAAAAVAAELKDAFGLDYGHAAAEPNSSDGKQSCTLLWNKATVDVVPVPWGEPVETWLKAKSTDFGELGIGGFEAVHGKIFDRHPARFLVTAKGVPAPGLRFYVVPVHLKAMSEGSLRRRMASKILAVAIQRSMEDEPGAEYVVGGDANAELGSGDFANLTDAGMTAVSAADEAGGAFSYIKGPKSLIDHVFLSPNLTELVGDEDFLVVAAESVIPDYVRDVSDHRPVLVRLSLGAGEPESAGNRPGRKGLDELKERLALMGVDSENGLERNRRKKKKPRRQGGSHGGNGTGAGRSTGLTGREGYDPAFLGDGPHAVPLPGLPPALSARAAVVDRQASGMARFVLPYTHFSVVQNADRRLPFYSAVNIDGTQLRKVPRGDDWQLDSRIPATAQVGNEAYKHNDLDKGHMTRRLDPVWGPPDVAGRANADTFYYTNSCPQHKDLNQKEWNDLEDYVLDNAGAKGLRVTVFTGPVFRDGDRLYRDVVRIPEEFWKVVVIVRGTSLSATGYVLSQRDMLNQGFEAGFAYGPFRTYQVTVRSIAGLTGLDFGLLPQFDPKDSGLESASAPTVVTGAASLVL